MAADDKNEIPEYCPMSDNTEKSSPVRCATCSYLKQVRWPHPGFWYCLADRIDKGLPDYR